MLTLLVAGALACPPTHVILPDQARAPGCAATDDVMFETAMRSEATVSRMFLPDGTPARVTALHLDESGVAVVLTSAEHVQLVWRSSSQSVVGCKTCPIRYIGETEKNLVAGVGVAIQGQEITAVSGFLSSGKNAFLPFVTDSLLPFVTDTVYPERNRATAVPSNGLGLLPFVTDSFTPTSVTVFEGNGYAVVDIRGDGAESTQSPLSPIDPLTTDQLQRWTTVNALGTGWGFPPTVAGQDYTDAVLGAADFRVAATVDGLALQIDGDTLIIGAGNIPSFP